MKDARHAPAADESATHLSSPRAPPTSSSTVTDAVVASEPTLGATAYAGGGGAGVRSRSPAAAG